MVNVPRESGEWAGARLLVVDDEAAQAFFLKEALEALEFQVSSTTSPLEALEMVRSGQFDILITDLQMPDLDGLMLTERALAEKPGLAVIVVTAHGTIETAVQAIRMGAEDYLRKPVELVELQLILHRIWKRRRLSALNAELEDENRVLKRGLAIRYHFTNAIGPSGMTQAILSQIRAQLENVQPLLILGEPGSGIEDVARMIHYNGATSEQPLSVFECHAIPSALHRSHLFGNNRNKGVAGRTAGGTLVLSEFQHLDPACYHDLRDFFHVPPRTGGPARMIVTATQKSLDTPLWETDWPLEIRKTLSDNVIRVPPLRARRQDIPIMATAIAQRLASALGKRIDHISADALRRLGEHDFPGNHRELESWVESAVIRCEGGVLELKHFRGPGLGSKSS